MAYGLILLPDPRTNAALSAYARRLTAAAPAFMCIGEVYLPHVTLLHVDASRDEAAALWDRSVATVPATLEVSPSGLQFGAIPVGDLYLPDGGVYVALEALRRADLDSAHRRVLGHARELGLTVLSGADDNFRPHVTLAALKPTDHVAAPMPPTELSSPFTTRLAWGEMGPYGTFSRIEATARQGY